jgi:DoxX-like family
VEPDEGCDAFSLERAIHQPSAVFGAGRRYEALCVPSGWWPWLSTARAAGAVGLAIGLFVPIVGVMAEAALILYFAAALVVVARALQLASRA